MAYFQLVNGVEKLGMFKITPKNGFEAGSLGYKQVKNSIIEMTGKEWKTNDDYIILLAKLLSEKGWDFEYIHYHEMEI